MGAGSETNGGTPFRDEQRTVSLGNAGASARREHARLRAEREQRLRAEHPRIGRLLFALQQDPSHEQTWAKGAEGEEIVARALARRCPNNALVLHDRRIPASRAKIDHIAVAPSGVWVIDSKQLRGRVKIAKPLFGDAKLMIRGHDQTLLVERLERQVALVEAAINGFAPDVLVHGALCFVDARLPWFGTVSFHGYSLLHPRALAKRLNAGGSLSAERMRGVAERLGERFVAA
jgi:hypothetical protein